MNFIKILILSDLKSLLTLVYGLQAAYVAVMQKVSASDRSGYESLLRVYRETDLSQEKTRILSIEKSFGKVIQNF